MAKSYVKGVSGVRQALRRVSGHLEEAIKAEVRAATEKTYALGRDNIDAMTVRRTGTLRREYRRSYVKKGKRGRVGYLTPRARAAAFYAGWVHYGTVTAGAHPFHALAAEVVEPEFLRRAPSAVRSALRKEFGR